MHQIGEWLAVEPLAAHAEQIQDFRPAKSQQLALAALKLLRGWANLHISLIGNMFLCFTL
ncbi:MAG: hypothetical protein NZ693_10740 [Thermoflexales bacterium]|nr:hypothetical protein [Thermoflexales bacterium]